MYPFDFEAFLWAIGNNTLIDFIRECYEKQRALGQALYRKAMEYFKEYLSVWENLYGMWIGIYLKDLIINWLKIIFNIRFIKWFKISFTMNYKMYVNCIWIFRKIINYSVIFINKFSKMFGWKFRNISP